ncbi:hypothetical protein [Pseudomonas syringae group genomosp. 3]|uniref:hypothetical protein n=1 Tax=Pseudomonas syringae group genomosp. 3 TaxID=251701 RepID=UPI001C818507|nr:hypothetical protein [Pseudomonas syringae group genomosp. 3]
MKAVQYENYGQPDVSKSSRSTRRVPVQARSAYAMYARGECARLEVAVRRISGSHLEFSVASVVHGDLPFASGSQKDRAESKINAIFIDPLMKTSGEFVFKPDHACHRRG